MGLENLKSIFTENFESRADDFQNNAPLLGDSIVVGMSSQFTEGIGGIFNKSTTYESSKFTPMSSPNVPSIEQILAGGNGSDGYPTKLSSYSKLTILQPEPGNGISFSPAGEDLRAVDGLGDLISDITTNRKRPSDTDWSDLYNKNHTVKENNNIHSYGSNVNRDKLNIRDNAPNITGISRNPLGLTQGEPYIISNLPSGDVGGLDGGRLQNSGNRYSPLSRALTDGVRITKYQSSAQGLLNTGLKNLYTQIQSVVIRDGEDLKKVPQRFKSKYNPVSTILSTAGRVVGEGLPNTLLDRTEPGGLSSLFESTTYGEEVTTSIHDTFEKGTPGLGDGDKNNTNTPLGFLDQLESTLTSFGILGKSSSPKQITGDKMTLAPMMSGIDIDSIKTKLGVEIEKEKDGMPFYFKDLRDDTYIFFRAYIDGLTENISPSWASTNYIGRSEPVYVYERSERDISFNLKLFAQTSFELESIYKKMNRLTSLCYPQYMEDVNLGGKMKMKPPLTKFRLGELFGGSNAELTGFIKSISYTYPQESPWETKAGRRVPKYVQVAMTYQVIHTTVPSLDFATSTDETFYGINKKEGVGV